MAWARVATVLYAHAWRYQKVHRCAQLQLLVDFATPAMLMCHTLPHLATPCHTLPHLPCSCAKPLATPAVPMYTL
eukprot:scaffold62061_cov18-Tisochrysis_lutea.AAC.2